MNPKTCPNFVGPPFLVHVFSLPNSSLPRRWHRGLPYLIAVVPIEIVVVLEFLLSIEMESNMPCPFILLFQVRRQRWPWWQDDEERKERKRDLFILCIVQVYTQLHCQNRNSQPWTHS